MAKKKLTYQEAAGELERIVEEIEAEEVDVDVLAERVKRAAFLIKTCKEKLRGTEAEVKKVLAGMETVPGPEGEEEEEEPEDEGGDKPLFG